MGNICKAFEMTDQNEQREHLKNSNMLRILVVNTMERLYTHGMTDVGF